MKIYSVNFLKYTDKNKDKYCYYYFNTLKEAQEKMEEIYKRYKTEYLEWNKSSDFWKFTISMEKFYQNELYKDKFDIWFIDTVEADYILN